MKEKRNLIFGILSGALLSGTFVFLWMNKKFEAQSEFQKMQIANHAVQLDSIRKISQANLLTYVLKKIDDELRINPKRALSKETISNIVSLCYSFKPYSYPLIDSISTKKLSPERGLLLLTLSGMNIDSVSWHKILSGATFSNADLREADLSKADLSGVDLSYSDLKGANLQSANLSKSDMSFSNLWGANLREVKLNEAILKRADLRWSDMNGANLRKADLHEADLTSAQLRKADLQEANIQWADLNGAFLNEANLTDADMYRTNMKRTDLEKAILRGAKLGLAILSEANLKHVDLSDADLNGTYIAEQNWLIRLNEWPISGANEIQNKYKVVDAISYDGSKYQLKKIKN